MTVETKNEVKTDITLTIEEEAYVSMMKYAHMFSPDECSGTGLVERIDNHDGSVEFNVTKVYLPNQNNTAGTTDIEDEEMAKINTQVVIDGDDPVLHKFHWHSHVDMSVFHSGTDDENYNEMQTGDYAVSLVVNKKYDMLGSVHLYKPLRINVLNINVEPPEYVDLDDKTYQIPNDLLKKLHKKVQAVKKWEIDNPPVQNNYKYNQYNHGRNAWGYDDDYYGGFGSGLAVDPDFEELLVQGELQGLIILLRDTSDTIVGYMNARTEDVYDLNSSYDYATEAEKKKYKGGDI